MIYLQHFGQSPLPAYEPAFDWETERSMIFGQRTPETPTTQYGRFNNLLQYRIAVSSLCICFCFILSFLCGCSGLKISVKVLSLSFQAGLVGEFFTSCFYIIWSCLFFFSLCCVPVLFINFLLFQDLNKSIFVQSHFMARFACIIGKEEINCQRISFFAYCQLKCRM